MTDSKVKYPLICDESVMDQKEHGTTRFPVQQNLRWGCDRKEASKICSYNRHYAEVSGYWRSTGLNTELRLKQIKNIPGISYFFDKNLSEEKITFYDSVTGKPLFIAPNGRTVTEFYNESVDHGWPSFRDSEVVWENVRCLFNGETVSLDGTHLGHNIPDSKGNRYCINLVSIAGNPIV